MVARWVWWEELSRLGCEERLYSELRREIGGWVKCSASVRTGF